MDDPLGAFLPGPRASLEGAPQGPLRGLTFAAKDIFDVAGQVTGCGNPDWARTHEPAVTNAPAVQAWLDAGATLVGKTISDELAYSLNGRNFHYGTPTNSNAPGRIPGGSSSGSAAAVAGGAVDLALGSDTGGSIRTPASYCGLFGLRPSHGRIPLSGVMPLAPTFDTIGWFARDAALLRRAGAVLLGDLAGEPSPPAGLLLAEDAFALAEPAVLSALSPLVARLEAQLGRAERVTIGEPGCGLEQWMLRFRVLQACEIWAQHGDWIEREKPRFGPEIQERFDWARSVPQSAVEEAGPQRDALTERLETLLRGGRVLCLPTTPGIAPLLSAGAEELRQHRSRVLSLTAIAGLARLPQVTMPLAQVEGCPLGLSLIAARGGDSVLLAFAERFAETTVARTETWGV